MEDDFLYLKRAALAWEVLRVFYNQLLLVVGLACTCRWWLKLGPHGDEFLLGVLFFGIAANVFYCLGPLADVYLCAVFRLRLGWGRCLLFAAGLSFSIGIILMLSLKLRF